jgi:hypothetical protein
VLPQSNYSTTDLASGINAITVLIGAAACAVALTTVGATTTYEPVSGTGLSGSPYLILDSRAFASTIGSSNFLNSTAIYVLSKLEALSKLHPSLVANFDDARNFAKSLPFDLPRPNIWTDAETEVALEWKDNSHHAMASFEGNHSFGYALRRGNRFVPGAFPGDLAGGVPRDLVNYLRDKAST